MRVAVVQTNPVFGEVAINVRNALALMSPVSADLFVLPELFNTGYNFLNVQEVERLAENSSGPTYEAVAEIARRKSSYVVYGYAERSGKLYNASALVGPAGLVGTYRKVHLYYRETVLFTPGDLGFPVFPTPFGNVGMMICFDWIYPESARSLALGGAHLIAHPSNLVMPYCPDAMVTRCLENRVFAATANRVGSEDRGGLRLDYIGNSEVVSPRGEILTRLDGKKEGVGVVEIDLSAAENKKINEYNDLFHDRRNEHYVR
jgi:5-aminopentanamidase